MGKEPHMKRIALVMVAVALAAMAGCNSDSQPGAPATKPRIALI